MLPIAVQSSFSRRIGLVLLALSALLWCDPGRAVASIQKGDTVKLLRSGNYGGADGGGRFDLYWYDSDISSFVKLGETFCLEFDEYIALNTSYTVGAVSQIAVRGGANTDSGDPLSFATDWLYKQYAEGTLDTVDLGGGTMFQYDNSTWNNAFQRAIWKNEDETGLGSGTVGSYATKLRDTALAATVSQTSYSDYVWALNLFKFGTDVAAFDPYDQDSWYDYQSKHQQDMLWYDPPTGQDGGSVPEPASLLIWSSLGVAGIGLARFIKRRQSS